MLHVHRSDRADGLVGALASLLAVPPADPFATEVVCVPTRGMERWLSQQLSSSLGATPGRADGICANVEFPSPFRLIDGVVATASGVDPDADPWVPERALWPLLDVIDDCIGEPWMRALSDHLGAPDDDVRRARRLGTARHLARLYNRYALHRPDLVRGWAEGEDGPIPRESAWQAELWRRLRERIAQPGPAERIEAACARLKTDADATDLPQRLASFGLTRLPTGHLDVLSALATHRDVHLFLLHPSPALWDTLAAQPPNPSRSRREDATVEVPSNALLASWGHDARETQLVLNEAAHEDHHHPVDRAADTLLARLQQDVRDDTPADGTHTLQPDDRSVQVHACHGRARQVEVLRDAILHELSEDPTLEPRDVIVMCPDIETFAPLIQATFGGGETPTLAATDDLDAFPLELKRADLRVRLADRSLRQTNPVLGVVAQLLELADERLTASQVLDLADREPVRRRFRFDDDDLERIQRWVADTGIRWGLDAAHRAPFKLAALNSGTWRAGLDRVLMGVAMTEDDQRQFAGVLPLDDIDSGSIELAGRFAEFIDRLGAALGTLTTPQPIAGWAQALITATDSLTTTSFTDAWQRAQVQRLLNELIEEAASTDTPLALPEARTALAERLQGQPTRANFRTGHLTICTLVPMRSVPHRIVCLLGLDDGVFPRKGPRDGDDLLLDDPHLGERDPRTEDRQQLLDALLAAEDRLIVTYTGNDERSNAPRPPAVPVGELLDAVQATAGDDAREHVLTRHPLQPFDPRNFTRGALVPDRTWSFDPVTLQGAKALTGKRHDPRPFLPQPLPPVTSTVVEVEDLVKFVQHPVRAFLRQRLGLSVGDFNEEVEDNLRIELDGLGRWAVGTRLLDARLSGVDGRTANLAEIARGTLPPATLGKPVLDIVFPVVDAILAAAQSAVPDGTASGSLDVRLPLPDGRTLSGTVPGVSGDVVRTVTYSRVGPKHRLAAWVRLLVLTAANPDRAFSAATVGKGGPTDAVIIRIPPLGDDAATRRDTAVKHLTTLLDLHARGLREPLPLYVDTSAAYAEAVAGNRDPEGPARKRWESEWNFDHEDKDNEHQLVHGGIATYDAIIEEKPRDDESGDGWDESDETRLGRLATRLWDGLLGAEETTAL